MKEINREKKYYQKIAKRFFYWTGKEPFLSVKDISLINFWRKKNIPLNIVLEAIDETFENSKFLRKEVKSLYFCNKKVLDAYKRYLERKVGLGREVKIEKKNKIEDALKEVETFLNNLPKEIEFLRPLYEKGLEFIKKEMEEELEVLDDEVEALIIRKFKKVNVQKNDELSKKRLIKEIRKKYKIPYLSLFYY